MVTSPPRVTASPMYSGMAGRVLHGASPLHPWDIKHHSHPWERSTAPVKVLSGSSEQARQAQ